MQDKRIVFVGVGGQGNLLITRLLGEAALAQGIPALVSEIHGMAQRGGIVESAVVLGNISSPIVAQGEADILVGFEPMETLRALAKVRKTGLVLLNTHPLPPFTVSLGQGTYPDLNSVLESIRSEVKALYSFDAKDLAEEAGNLQSLNMVLLGGLIALKQLPIGSDQMQEIIRTHTKKPFVDANLKAFTSGFQRITASLN